MYSLFHYFTSCRRNSSNMCRIEKTMHQQLNYMDPRISVAWCKRNEVPIEKIFSKTMRDKFNWAMAVPPCWRFNEEIGKQG